MESDLELAHELADAADAVTLARFRTLDLHVETKPDLSPVSDADREAERAIRAILAVRRPAEAVVGEELGGDGTTGEGHGEAATPAQARWIVDPIDGTRNYVRGTPVWATLLALEREAVVETAVVSAPALGRRWWAQRGAGAWAGVRTAGSRCRVSRVSRVQDAVVSTTSAPGMPDGWRELAAAAWSCRGFGDFWQYCLLAEGSVDVATDEQLHLWDYAAVQLLVEEAGGRCTTFDCKPPRPGGSFLASNGLLHEAALSALASRQRDRHRGQTP